MKKLGLVLALLFVMAGSAGAVPQTVSFTGRLTTSAGPVNGSVNLTFRLFNVATSGSALWTEVRNGVGASNGLVFVDLGQVTALDSSLFTGSTMYIEIQVGTETLAPRLEINSVPYAMHSGDSDTLGGSVTASNVITSASGTNGITAVKTGNALSVSLSTTGCSTGQVYKYNGSAFACAADDNTPPVAGAGIAVSGNTVSLSTSGCLAGYVWKYSGSAWSCLADANTTYTAGGGIAITGTTVSLSTAGCAAGDVWKYNGSTWACQGDANTTYTAGAGIDISGTTVSLSTTGCAAGSVWQFNGSTWACTGVGTVTDVTASAPLSSSGGTTPVISLTGQVPVGNGGNRFGGEWASYYAGQLACSQQTTSTCYLKNPLTGNCSCPTGYSAAPVSENYISTAGLTNCTWLCSR